MAAPTGLPVLLAGYDAKRCQRRIHNDHDRTLESVPWEPPADLQKRFDEGRAFEERVFGVLMTSLAVDRVRDLSGLRGKRAVVEATIAAMDDGVDLILGGWLPDDEAVGRTGRPDLLLRAGSGYLPGDVKWHKATRAVKSGRLRYSVPGAPADLLETKGRAPVTTTRVDDYLQLAHYWRMLEACGAAAEGAARGAIIGTDRLTDLDGSGFTLTWLALDEPLFLTFSRSKGKAKRTALERYDFEHGIRFQIATVAEQRTGAPDDPEPLVKPIFSSECDSCGWHDYCRGLADDAPSAHIKIGRLDVREWRALDQLGITTLAELADLDPTDEAFHARYLPEVTHQGSGAVGRLATAVRRARMARDGVVLQRETTGPVPVPRADVEIDFDIEDAQGSVYLWGALVSDGENSAVFDPTVSWQELDAEAERALAQQFVDWVRGIRDRAAAEGRTVLVYHYTSYEVSALNRILGAAEVADVLKLFVDLYAIVGAHFIGVEGLGLKKVAPAFGFAWRDEEPSGLMSQVWYLDAVQTDDPTKGAAAKKRLLAYNEDDVRATLAVRNGITTT